MESCNIFLIALLGSENSIGVHVARAQTDRSLQFSIGYCLLYRDHSDYIEKKSDRSRQNYTVGL